MRVLTLIAMLALAAAKLAGVLEWGWLAVVLIPAMVYWGIDGAAYSALISVQAGDGRLHLARAARGFVYDCVISLLVIKFTLVKSWQTAALVAGAWAGLLTSVSHYTTCVLVAAGSRCRDFWWAITAALVFAVARYYFHTATEWPRYAVVTGAAVTAVLLPSCLSLVFCFFVDTLRRDPYSRSDVDAWASLEERAMRVDEPKKQNRDE